MRQNFDARISERDLRETYLPAFEACVKEGKAYSVMCAYNRFDGKACCGSDTLLLKILRDEWGFEGYVVSDCGAISDIYQGHHVLKTVEDAAALGVKSGCDLSCGQEYGALLEAARESIVLLKNDNHTLPLNKNLKRAVEPGFFTIAVGGKQPGFKGTADSLTTEVLTARFEVIGETKIIE